MDIRTITALIALRGLVLTGCPAEEPGGGDDDDDDSANPGDDDDDDDVIGDDDDFWGGDTEGTVSLMYANASGMDFGVTFTATFNTIVTPATPGYLTNVPVGMDDCALTHFPQDELLGGDPGEYVSESAGTINLSGGGISLDVEPQSQQGTIGYNETLPTGQFQFSTDYAVTAAGDEFPGFSGTLPMTSMPTLVTPEPEGFFQIAGGDFPIEWTGYDGSDAAIIMTFVDEFQDGAVIICIVNNDGSFTVPGNLIDQFPTGSGSLMVEQYTWETISAGGRNVALLAGAGVMATGMTP